MTAMTNVVPSRWIEETLYPMVAFFKMRSLGAQTNRHIEEASKGRRRRRVSLTYTYVQKSFRCINSEICIIRVRKDLSESIYSIPIRTVAKKSKIWFWHLPQQVPTHMWLTDTLYLMNLFQVILEIQSTFAVKYWIIEPLLKFWNQKYLNFLSKVSKHTNNNYLSIH